MWAVERLRVTTGTGLARSTAISLGVSIGFHLLVYLMRGVEAAFAAAMLTVPVVWLIGFAVNSVAGAVVRAR